MSERLEPDVIEAIKSLMHNETTIIYYKQFKISGQYNYIRHYYLFMARPPDKSHPFPTVDEVTWEVCKVVGIPISKDRALRTTDIEYVIRRLNELVALFIDRSTTVEGASRVYTAQSI